MQFLFAKSISDSTTLITRTSFALQLATSYF